jgi:hypothetical protein
MYEDDAAPILSAMVACTRPGGLLPIPSTNSKCRAMRSGLQGKWRETIATLQAGSLRDRAYLPTSEHDRSEIVIAAAALQYLLLSNRSSQKLAAENLFLRKQLALFQEREIKPRRADDATRAALVWLSRAFNWRDALVVVKPAALIRWHREGFRCYWKLRSRPGRPSCRATFGH